MRSFTGDYLQRLDEKNRVVLPVQLRRPLTGEEIERGFFLTRGFEGCLLLLDPQSWEQRAQEVQALSSMRREVRIFQRLFFSKAQLVKLDAQNRLTIPDSHRQLASIEKDVIFAGVGAAIEIWAKEKYESHEGDVSGEYAELAERLFPEESSRGGARDEP